MKFSTKVQAKGNQRGSGYRGMLGFLVDLPEEAQEELKDVCRHMKKEFQTKIATILHRYQVPADQHKKVASDIMSNLDAF